MNNIKILFLVLVLSSSLSAGKITIAVAANVSYAIEELKEEFKKLHPEISVLVTLGSSGKLAAQIKNGAPYGLFMSANMNYPEALYRDHIALNAPVVYAQGALAYLSVEKRDLTKGMVLLEDEQIARIAIANPKTAPYGIAALEAMKRGGVYERVKGKLIYAESISQTVSYAVTAAQIGLIAKSSLYSPHMTRYKEDVNWKSVDPALYTPIKQGIVLLRYGQENAEYKAFYDFILSDQAKRVLKRYGYIVL
jgi:molybdate transport system substrate-binding protein